MDLAGCEKWDEEDWALYHASLVGRMEQEMIQGDFSGYRWMEKDDLELIEAEESCWEEEDDDPFPWRSPYSRAEEETEIMIQRPGLEPICESNDPGASEEDSVNRGLMPRYQKKYQTKHGAIFMNLTKEFMVPIFRTAIRHARQVCGKRADRPSRTERTGIFANSLRQAWRDALTGRDGYLRKSETDQISDRFFEGEAWWDIGVLSPKWTGIATMTHGRIDRDRVEDWLTAAMVEDDELDIEDTFKELEGMVAVADRSIESTKRINQETEQVFRDMGDALSPVINR